MKSALLRAQAKSKKDAKQLAAAALLEVMLDHVPFQELLYKSDKQQSFKDLQVHTLMHEDRFLTRPPPRTAALLHKKSCAPSVHDARLESPLASQQPPGQESLAQSWHLS